MIFSTYTYILIFLPSVFLLVFNKSSIDLGKSFQLLVLILSSIFFYAYWNPSLLPLIIGSILFNYVCANLMDVTRNHRKKILVFGILGNLSFLAYFKYFNFFAGNYNSFVGSDYFMTDVALPLAISFYTLQQIAFLVDYFQNYISEKLSIRKYFGFVLFFPQLIAGPIVHYKHLTSQFSGDIYRPDHRNITIGILLITIGLFKKVFIGDQLAPFVNFGYENIDNLTFITSWLLSLSFYIQIYFDFSGYADMAIGSALLFNIKLPVNFNSPYKSRSLIDFWKRWHITLSDFLNHYLYVPLLRAGKAITFKRAMVVTFATMFVSGIWHGAGWMFMIWGAIHGVGLIINHCWSKYCFSLPKVLAWIVTYAVVIIALVFFRSPNLKTAEQIIGNMFGFSGIVLPKKFEEFIPNLVSSNIQFESRMFQDVGFSQQTFLILIFGSILAFTCKNSSEIAEAFKPSGKWLLFMSVVILISIVTMGSLSGTEFIYYEF